MLEDVEKNYSFQAPADLGDRIQEASEFLGEVGDASSWERISREMALAMARDSGMFEGVTEGQFVRAAVELFVSATLKVKSDLHYTALYASAADGNPDEHLRIASPKNRPLGEE